MSQRSSRSWRGGFCLVAMLAMLACGDDDDGAPSGNGGSDGGTTGFKGTVTWKGVTEDCEVSTQNFAASGEYSVLCQTAGTSAGTGTVLVQLVFKDEASARTPGDFKPFDGPAFSPADHPDGRTVEVSVIDDQASASDDTSTGSISVAASGGHHVVTVTSVQQFIDVTEDGGVVSATISF